MEREDEFGPSGGRRSFGRIAGIGVAVAVGAAVAVASAATLGGITSTGLGAENTVVAACDTDGISVGYANQYAPGSQRFVVAQVIVSDIDPACTGKALALTLGGSGGAAVGSATVTVASTSETLAMADLPPAEDVESVAVVITG
jgi:hypothetical protein